MSLVAQLRLTHGKQDSMNRVGKLCLAAGHYRPLLTNLTISSCCMQPHCDCEMQNSNTSVIPLVEFVSFLILNNSHVPLLSVKLNSLLFSFTLQILSDLILFYMEGAWYSPWLSI